MVVVVVLVVVVVIIMIYDDGSDNNNDDDDEEKDLLVQHKPHCCLALFVCGIHILGKCLSGCLGAPIASTTV